VRLLRSLPPRSPAVCSPSGKANRRPPQPAADGYTWRSMPSSYVLPPAFLPISIIVLLSISCLCVEIKSYVFRYTFHLPPRRRMD